MPRKGKLSADAMMAAVSPETAVPEAVFQFRFSFNQALSVSEAQRIVEQVKRSYLSGISAQDRKTVTTLL